MERRHTAEGRRRGGVVRPPSLGRLAPAWRDSGQPQAAAFGPPAAAGGEPAAEAASTPPAEKNGDGESSVKLRHETLAQNDLRSLTCARSLRSARRVCFHTLPHSLPTPTFMGGWWCTRPVW